MGEYHRSTTPTPSGSASTSEGVASRLRAAAVVDAGAMAGAVSSASMMGGSASSDSFSRFLLELLFFSPCHLPRTRANGWI